MDRVESFRAFFADSITANAGIRTPEGGLKAAFGSTPREHFVGLGPWKVFDQRDTYLHPPTIPPSYIKTSQ